MEGVLLVIGLVDVVPNVAFRVVIPICKKNIHGPFMNIKVNILVAGPLPVPGKFRSDNAGNAIQRVPDGGDGNDAPCASVIFSPRIGYKFDRLHIGGG